MSIQRLTTILSVPSYVKKVFNSAPESATPEEKLWRARAARMTLDALGHTNLTTKKRRHNDAVRYARRWFRGLYMTHPDCGETDDPEATFDAASLTGFREVRDAVLAVEPILFPDSDEKDEPIDN